MSIKMFFNPNILNSSALHSILYYKYTTIIIINACIVYFIYSVFLKKSLLSLILSLILGKLVCSGLKEHFRDYNSCPHKAKQLQGSQKGHYNKHCNSSWALVCWPGSVLFKWLNSTRAEPQIIFPSCTHVTKALHQKVITITLLRLMTQTRPMHDPCTGQHRIWFNESPAPCVFILIYFLLMLLFFQLLIRV